MFLAWLGTWVCMLYPWGGVDMCKHAFRRLLLIAVSGCLVRPVVSGTCFVLCGELGHSILSECTIAGLYWWLVFVIGWVGFVVS